MSELACTCPHCNQGLNIESEYSGQVVACPSCNGEFTVPDAPAASAPKLNAPALGAASQQRQAATNPYQAPATNVAGPGSPQAAAVGPRSIQLFAQTKPWVTFFAVLGSISPAIMVLLGIVAAVGGASAGESGTGMTTGLLFAAMGGIYFIPAWRLWQYHSAINKLRYSPSQMSLEGAIDRQRCFWKTVGIITLIGIGLTIAMYIYVASTISNMASDPGFRFSE